MGEPRVAGERRALFLTKAMLLMVAIGLCVVGRRLGAWPLVGWPMYSARWPEMPPPIVSVIELRVASADGRVRVFTPADLHPFERIYGLERLFEHAFDPHDSSHRDADREYLLALIQRSSGRDVLMVEGWQLRWTTNAWAVPPLERDRPLDRTLLGSFSREAAR